MPRSRWHCPARPRPRRRGCLGRPPRHAALRQRPGVQREAPQGRCGQSARLTAAEARTHKAGWHDRGEPPGAQAAANHFCQVSADPTPTPNSNHDRNPLPALQSVSGAIKMHPSGTRVGQAASKVGCSLRPGAVSCVARPPGARAVKIGF